MSEIYIKSTNHYLASGKLNNEDVISKMLDDSKDFLSEEEKQKVSYGHNKKLNFIKSKTRATPIKNESYIQMAHEAAKGAIERAGLKPEDIDGIIGAGITNPLAEPTLAIVLANLLGIEKGNFFDISDTCNSFMKSMETAILYLKSGKCKNVLIVACESFHEMIKQMPIEEMQHADYKFSNLMVGCGAGAIILSTDKTERKVCNYSDVTYSTDWDASFICFHDIPLPMTRYNKDKIYGFWSDSRKISALWMKGTADFMKKTVKQWNTDLDSIDKFIFHQLGDNTTFGIMKKANVPKEKAPLNTYNEYGNLGSANVPVILSMAEKENMIKKGESVLLVSGGGGFSFSAALLQW